MSSKILVFAGSTRAKSLNVQLAHAIRRALEAHEVDVEYIDLADYEMPIFSHEISVPKTTLDLAEKFAKADGVIICSPEYNASVTPLLKNTIDWVSQVKTTDSSAFGPFKDKAYYLTACSPGSLGGIRGLYHLRAILMNVGATIITPQLTVPNGAFAFTDKGDLVEERLTAMMDDGLATLVRAIEGTKQLA